MDVNVRGRLSGLLCVGVGPIHCLNHLSKHKRLNIYIYNIYIYFAGCRWPRSGGPSLRKSAEYPQAFAEWMANHHIDFMVSWLY